MVAYSFSTAFVGAIVARTKRQTIRLPRKRHARPGERVQLYQGMRTRHCRKLIPDPVCVGLDEVRIDMRGLANVDREEGRPDWREFVGLEVNGISLHVSPGDIHAEDYARGDGFAGISSLGISHFEHMVRWWLHTHGPILFVGVAMRWDDADALAGSSP